MPGGPPDGSRLAFWRGRAAATGTTETAVFTVAADGTGLRQLTPWKLLAGDPDWSPDGSVIVFGTHPLLEFPDAGQSELYTIRPDGTGQRQLTSYGPTGPRATQPAGHRMVRPSSIPERPRPAGHGISTPSRSTAGRTPPS